jgi:hypothetical protein
LSYVDAHLHLADLAYAGKVESVARDVITNELPTDMIELFGVNVKTKVVGVRDGSLLLFFEVVLAGFNIISDYSGFFDSIELIKSQCRRLLSMRLKDQFNEDFEIGVQTVYPSVPEPMHKEFRRWMDRWRHFPMEFYPEMGLPPVLGGRERGGLFYFLVVSNIVLLLIIGILVYAAVLKTYF